MNVLRDPIGRSIVDAAGLPLSMLEAGPADGPVVVLIHGLGWDALSLWRGTIAALSEAGFRVLAPDMRGVGATPATEAAYSIDLYAADVVAALQTLGVTRLAFAGFSLGAPVAAAAALRHGGASALVLACGGLSSSPQAEAGTENMLARVATLSAREFAMEQAEAIFHPAWAEAHPGAVAAFIERRTAMDQDALFRAFRSARGIDLRASVAGLGVPVQVIAAAEDSFITVEALRAIADGIPGARFAVLPDCGHMAPVERPDLFEPLLAEFLTAIGAPA
ncbi:alpha/beta fold hydrolase [Histidinibacterium lentulum]|nr:alpha/beta fold hydrolase [Histidinibacterium lentulum]